MIQSRRKIYFALDIFINYVLNRRTLMNQSLLHSLTLLFFLTASAAFSEDARIEQIRAKYNATESAKLSKRTIKLDAPVEMVELVKFYDTDGILVKMAFTSSGGHSAGTDYYYVDRGTVYFVFSAGGYWSFDFDGPKGTTVDTASERRVYYSGNQVIRHLLKEARSKDPDAITGLLKKAKNRAVSDVEAETILLSDAQHLLLVDTKKELEKFLDAR